MSISRTGLAVAGGLTLIGATIGAGVGLAENPPHSDGLSREGIATALGMAGLGVAIGAVAGFSLEMLSLRGSYRGLATAAMWGGIAGAAPFLAAGLARDAFN